jgi:hypothetical protein
MNQGNGGPGRPVHAPHEHHLFGAGRGPGPVHHPHIQPGEPAAKVPRIGNGGRAEHKHGIGPVIPADAHQAPEHPGHVGPHDSPVSVHLIHHHKGQAPEIGLPQVMVGQHGQMQHLRVGQQHLGRIPPDFRLVMGGHIPVIHPARSTGRSGARLLARTSRSCTVPNWSRASAFNGNRYRAVAEGSDRSRSTTGRLYTRLLPDAVGVAITV